MLDGKPPASGHQIAVADREPLLDVLTLLKSVTDSLRTCRNQVRTRLEAAEETLSNLLRASIAP